MTGLGLQGAVAINLLGAGTVLVWLELNPFELPVREYCVLRAAVVLATADLPAVLLQSGFIFDQAEDIALGRPEYQREPVNAVTGAIEETCDDG